jgi:hypothetical protein
MPDICDDYFTTTPDEKSAWCQLPVGHEGQHRYEDDDTTLLWDRGVTVNRKVRVRGDSTGAFFRVVARPGGGWVWIVPWTDDEDEMQEPLFRLAECRELQKDRVQVIELEELLFS